MNGSSYWPSELLLASTGGWAASCPVTRRKSSLQCQAQDDSKSQLVSDFSGFELKGCSKSTTSATNRNIILQQSKYPYRNQGTLNFLTPNVNYSGRTAPLTSKVAFYILIQQIQVLNILNMVYTLRFFSSKCSLFHNPNIFVSCIIHILYTGCAKI